MKKQLSNLRNQLGQGMTEYIIIVALIAVAAIGVYQMFGETVQNQTAAIAAELGGTDGNRARSRATSAGAAAQTSAIANDAALNNFTEENNVTSGGGAP